MFTSDTHIDLNRPTGGLVQDVVLTKTQMLAALAVSTGSMIVGYSSAWSSPAIASLMEPGSHIEVLMKSRLPATTSSKSLVLFSGHGRRGVLDWQLDALGWTHREFYWWLPA